MSNGIEKPIKELKENDLVSAYNLKTNQMENVKVIKVFKHIQADYYIISFADNSTLEVTGIHPLYTLNGYVRVKNLKIHNKVAKIKDNKLSFIEIIDIQKSPKKETVYNLEVDKLHNYFANGFLAHNKSCNSPFQQNNNTVICNCTEDGPSCLPFQQQ